MSGAIAEDPRLTAENVTAQYARFFFGAKAAPVWEEALGSLEMKSLHKQSRNLRSHFLC